MYTVQAHEQTHCHSPDDHIDNDVDCHKPQCIVDNQLDGPASTCAVPGPFDCHHDICISVDELHDLLYIPHETPATNNGNSPLACL